jgi:hypothetical protein
VLRIERRACKSKCRNLKHRLMVGEKSASLFVSGVAGCEHTKPLLFIGLVFTTIHDTLAYER